MIVTQEILRMVRFKQKDNNEIRFSDYDIKEALNECIRYFNNSYALQNSDFLEKTAFYDNSNAPEKICFCGQDLPEDFIVLHDLINPDTREKLSPCVGAEMPRHNQYKVSGDKLYLGCPRAVMMYKGAIAEVKNEEDVIELPFVFKDTLAKITCMILENNANTDVLMEAVNNAVASIVPRRKYVNAKMKMPFIV